MQFEAKKIIFLFLPLLLGLLFTGLLSTIYFLAPSLPIQREDPFYRAEISFIGDLMTHKDQINSAKTTTDSYDFTNSFKYIKPALSCADITVGNLETTISDKEHGYFGFPLFRAPQEYIKAIKEAGVDILTTSNNHSFDGATFGIDNTIETLKKYGIKQTGTYSSKADSKKNLIINVNGIKIALFAYAHSVNGNEWKIPKDEQKWRLFSIYKKEIIKKQFKEAREAGADLIVADVHWGAEYQRAPNRDQKRLAKILGEYGADIIAGSHPHVLQPVEWITINPNTNKERKILVAWSLGNILAHMGHDWHKHSDTAMIWNISIMKNKKTNKVTITNTNYTPTWIYIKKSKSKKSFTILPLYDDESQLKNRGLLLDKRAIKRYKDALKETKELLDCDWFMERGSKSSCGE